MQEYAEVIHEKGAALENSWGFIDGTVRAISRTETNQRVMYNGHKKMHVIKFQSIVAPNGLIGNLYGPVEGKRHDSAMLAQSQAGADPEANHIFNNVSPILINISVQMRFDFHLHFILTWFENTSDNTKH